MAKQTYLDGDDCMAVDLFHLPLIRALDQVSDPIDALQACTRMLRPVPRRCPRTQRAAERGQVVEEARGSALQVGQLQGLVKLGRHAAREARAAAMSTTRV